MVGRPHFTSVAQRVIVQQVAAQLAERLPQLRQWNSAVTLSPSKPAGPLSKGTLSLGGCFLSTPAGPLPKGTKQRAAMEGAGRNGNGAADIQCRNRDRTAPGAAVTKLAAVVVSPTVGTMPWRLSALAACEPIGSPGRRSVGVRHARSSDRWVFPAARHGRVDQLQQSVWHGRSVAPSGVLPQWSASHASANTCAGVRNAERRVEPVGEQCVVDQQRRRDRRAREARGSQGQGHPYRSGVLGEKGGTLESTLDFGDTQNGLGLLSLDGG